MLIQDRTDKEKPPFQRPLSGETRCFVSNETVTEISNLL